MAARLLLGGTSSSAMIVEVKMELNSFCKSHQNIWEKRASVRARPRIKLTETDHHYPIQRQPLCIHPITQNLGDEAIQYILIQSAYKFMFNIARLETEIINQVATKIANNDFKIKFPDEMRLDAYTIIVDEAYHAYVAYDYILQMKKITGVTSIYNDYEKGALSHAINEISPTLDNELKEAFELIAVCIAENSITNELSTLMKEGNVNQGFKTVISDHLSDEGRHSSYFSRILKFYWAELEDHVKNKLVPILPAFIKKYVTFDEEQRFAKKILQSLLVSDELIERILMDTYISYDDKAVFQINPVAKNIMQLFERCDVLGYPGMQRVLQ